MENRLNKEFLPHHIGIIMDGNGRWAKKRGLPRKAGHSQGAKAFKKCVDDCIDLGLECVTFYTFSTENWKRPKDEVDSIMKLLDQYLDDVRSMSQRNVKLIFIGNPEPLSDSIKRKMTECEDETRNNTGLKVCIALNYGGRDEIIRAVKLAAEDIKNGVLTADKINEDSFNKFLYTNELPEVDLIIRPSGEQRTSNFLIYQAAYAELVFMDVLWPDFGKKELISALMEYADRNRRFGGI